MCIAGLNNDNSCNALNDQSISDEVEKEPTETPTPDNDHYLRYENYELNLEANNGILHTADCDTGDTATGGGYEFEG